MATLKLGARGPEVTQLQLLLRSAGFYTAAIGELFGPATKQAVVAFQTSRGLTVDGIVGPQTWAALQQSQFVGPAPVAPMPSAPNAAPVMQTQFAPTVGGKPFNWSLLAGVGGGLLLLGVLVSVRKR